MTFDEREEFMGIMDNEGHDPMGFGNVRSAGPMQADPDPHAALKEARAEIEQLRLDYLRICAGHDQLHDERDDARAEIERLQAVLRPFAECIDEHTVFCGNPDAAEVEVGNWANLRFNDFVKAREALAVEQK